MGLSETIIDGAKQLLSQNDVRFEDVIANAEYHRQIAEKERAMAEETHQDGTTRPIQMGQPDPSIWDDHYHIDGFWGGWDLPVSEKAQGMHPTRLTTCVLKKRTFPT